MKKTLDIANRYSHELKTIAKITQQLKKGRIYELTGETRDEDLYTQVKMLEKRISDLFFKIEYGKESFNEEIEACFSVFFDEKRLEQ